MSKNDKNLSILFYKRECFLSNNLNSWKIKKRNNN